jgi:ribosomal protein S18 acetylase RimI-like enzyme
MQSQGGGTIAVSLTIRPLTPADYAAIVAIENTASQKPGSVEAKAAFIDTFPKDKPVTHLVAEDGGQVVGYAMAYNASWIGPDRMMASIVVAPERRSQGIGTALANALAPFFAQHRPAKLSANVSDKDATSVAWAERRGFVKAHHFFDSVLRLAEFDPAPFAGHVEQVEARGFSFVPFDQIRTPETERRLYDLHHELMWDMPNGPEVARATFADWRDWLLGGPDAFLQGCLIAMDAEGRWVGMTAVKKTDCHAHIEFTGVAPACRGAGLALALKLKGMAVLQAASVTDVTTSNHAANGPMLAVNQKLGYRPLPGRFFMLKQMMY